MLSGFNGLGRCRSMRAGFFCYHDDDDGEEELEKVGGRERPPKKHPPTRDWLTDWGWVGWLVWNMLVMPEGLI